MNLISPVPFKITGKIARKVELTTGEALKLQLHVNSEVYKGKIFKILVTKGGNILASPKKTLFRPTWTNKGKDNRSKISKKWATSFMDGHYGNFKCFKILFISIYD